MCADTLKPLYLEGYIGMTPVHGSSSSLGMDQLVIGPYVQKALVSSFVLDPEWLLNHFPTRIPLCVVMHEPEAPKRTLKQDNVVYVFPPISTGCMHIKLLVC